MNADVTTSPARIKQCVRKSIRAARVDHSVAWIERASRQITEHVIALPEVNAAAAMAVYMSLPYEVQTRRLVTELLARGVRLAVPALAAGEKSYRFSWIDPETEWTRGPYGVPQPAETRWAGDGELDVKLAPCVAFDGCGRRLGHGTGHFDALLDRYQGLNAGLAFAFQEVESLPVEAHDVPMSLLVTENGARRCNRKSTS
jgi:5-formyltetrahydrofolate cyclo-ligase